MGGAGDWQISSKGCVHTEMLAGKAGCCPTGRKGKRGQSRHWQGRQDPGAGKQDASKQHRGHAFAEGRMPRSQQTAQHWWAKPENWGTKGKGNATRAWCEGKGGGSCWAEAAGAGSQDLYSHLHARGGEEWVGAWASFRQRGPAERRPCIPFTLFSYFTKQALLS